LILDSTKNKDESIIEIAAWMIMSALVDFAQFHPIVNLCIKKLHSVSCATDLFSRSGNKNIPIADLAARVTVSSILHPFHFFEFEVVVGGRLVRDKLFAHEHAIWEWLVVTTSEYEYTRVLKTNLNHLEIMREVASVLYVFMS
jgi:hypothetical protein